MNEYEPYEPYEPYKPDEGELLSRCCGAPESPIGNMIENCAICSQCGEWADFYDEDEELPESDNG